MDISSIAQLIARRLCDDLTPEEGEQLAAWRAEAPANEQLFQRLSDIDNWKRYNEQAAAFNLPRARYQVQERIRKERIRRLWRHIGKYAAILLLPLCMGATLLYMVHEREMAERQPVAQAPAIEPILPGERKAVLQLSDGAIVDLEQQDSLGVQENDGTNISVESSTINYSVAADALAQAGRANATDKIQTKSQKEIYNTIVVPRGGEYAVKLSDGTTVHLNAMSSLKFPVQFTGDQRAVKLTGEAFFEVQKEARPFIVETELSKIEVLGTTFNVCAYDDEAMQATLVTGSIQLSTPSRKLVLRPSQQAVVAADNPNIEVKRVDTSFYTSWYQGKIHFQDVTLGEMMKILSRWYNIQVSYRTEALRQLRFGCYVNRYEEITPFLRLLEATGKVQVARKENHITFF
jgi:ferric-dicitrate binding protein FerR (iron transport regulator)